MMKAWMADPVAMGNMKQTGGGHRMGKVIELTDEQYRTLAQVATAGGQTLDALLAEWIEELRDRDRDPRYYETDDWLRHLGMSDEAIRRIDEEIRVEAETD